MLTVVEPKSAWEIGPTYLRRYPPIASAADDIGVQITVLSNLDCGTIVREDVRVAITGAMLERLSDRVECWLWAGFGAGRVSPASDFSLCKDIEDF